MKSRVSSRHIIQTIFPLLLLLLFVLSAMMMVLLAADLYGDITGRSQRTSDARLATAYLTEKIHQSNTAGGVQLAQLADLPALLLQHQAEDARYCTYIYYYEGALRELLVEEGYEPAPDRGRKILPLAEFQARQLQENLLCFSCTDQNENSTSVYVTIQSDEE